MKHIEKYMKKIEAIIAAKEKTDVRSSKSKGLLAPSKMPSEEKPKSDIDVIAGFVQSIRQERKGILNG